MQDNPIIEFSKILLFVFLIVSSISIVGITAMYLLASRAAPNTAISQTINAGTLAVDIRDASRVAISSPSFAMSAKAFSFDCQSGGSASTGTIGSSTQRIYVDNPGAANNGWTLSIAPSSGVAALWQNTGVTRTYDYNDASGSGCTDGVDADSVGGQMTVNANPGTLTADCSTCALTNVVKGTSGTYVSGTTDSITLLNAAAGSDDVWRGYLTGVTVSQTIPAEQAPDTYSINMTLTVTSL